MEKLIKHVKTHINITDHEIEQVNRLFKHRSFQKGDVVLEEGKVCTALYFVVSGLLRHFINYDGKEITIHFNEENTFASDYDSFISQTKSIKTIEALEDTEVYFISHADLQTFYQVVESGDRFGRLLLEEVFILTVRHIVSVHRDTEVQRYMNFMRSYKHLKERIRQYYIASFIGVTPQSLSRIRRRMAENKFVTTG